MHSQSLYSVLKNVPISIFCEFPHVSLNCGPVISQCAGQTPHLQAARRRGGDSKCWVRAACVFLMGADAFSERLWRAECDLVEMEKPVTGNKMFLLPPAIVQGLQFCLGTEQCCFFLSFLICRVTGEKEVHGRKYCII